MRIRNKLLLLSSAPLILVVSAITIYSVVSQRATKGEALAQKAQLFGELPGQITAKVLALMNPAERRKTQIILGYPPESIGRIMTPDYLTVRPEWTVQQVLQHIRRHGKDAETFNTLYVVDELGILVDEVRLRQLLLADSSTTVESLIDRHVISLPAHADREEAVRVMSRYDFPVLPVVDSGGVLVGIVTFDDIADVAQRETTEDIQKLGAVQVLEEPYMSATLWELVRKRGGWLSVLFLGEMLTASAMTFFQAEIEKAAVVALFVPLIISSGGNSGSQASTLIIRAMALGEIRLKDWLRVLRREAACGLILGVVLGVIGLLRIHVWQLLHLANYDSNRAFVKDAEHKVYNLPGLYHMIGLTVGIALIGVVLWGTLMGAMLPFLLKKLRLDPATISAPLVATLVDVTGLIIYFTTAMILLRHTLL